VVGLVVAAALVVLPAAPAGACSCGGGGTVRAAEFDGVAARVVEGERELSAVWEFTEVHPIWGAREWTDTIRVRVGVGTPHVTDPGRLISGGCPLVERVQAGAQYRIVAAGEGEELSVSLCSGSMTLLAAPPAPAEDGSSFPSWWPWPLCAVLFVVGLGVGRRWR
jgi:hypothetical protein